LDRPCLSYQDLKGKLLEILSCKHGAGERFCQCQEPLSPFIATSIPVSAWELHGV
jgi:hypothetical protein